MPPSATVSSLLMSKPEGSPDIPYRTKVGSNIMKRRFDTLAGRRAFGNSQVLEQAHLSLAMSRLVEKGIYLPMSAEMIDGEIRANTLISEIQREDERIGRLAITPFAEFSTSKKEVPEGDDSELNRPSYSGDNAGILKEMKERVQNIKQRADRRTDYIGLYNSLREQKSAIEDMHTIYNQLSGANGNVPAIGGGGGPPVPPGGPPPGNPPAAGNRPPAAGRPPVNPPAANPPAANPPAIQQLQPNQIAQAGGQSLVNILAQNPVPTYGGYQVPVGGYSSSNFSFGRNPTYPTFAPGHQGGTAPSIPTNATVQVGGTTVNATGNRNDSRGSNSSGSVSLTGNRLANQQQRPSLNVETIAEREKREYEEWQAGMAGRGLTPTSESSTSSPAHFGTRSRSSSADTIITGHQNTGVQNANTYSRMASSSGRRSNNSNPPDQFSAINPSPTPSISSSSSSGSPVPKLYPQLSSALSSSTRITGKMVAEGLMLDYGALDASKPVDKEKIDGLEVEADKLNNDDFGRSQFLINIKNAMTNKLEVSKHENDVLEMMSQFNPNLYNTLSSVRSYRTDFIRQLIDNSMTNNLEITQRDEDILAEMAVIYPMTLTRKLEEVKQYRADYGKPKPKPQIFNFSRKEARNMRQNKK